VLKPGNNSVTRKLLCYIFMQSLNTLEPFFYICTLVGIRCPTGLHRRRYQEVGLPPV